MEYKIGDIVSLKSHPFREQTSAIQISGEPGQVPPLMLIIEIIRDVRDQYDEHTGSVITLRDQGQCKCIWYSTKSNQFEEIWIHSGSLKHIKEAENNQDNPQIKKGDLVSLKSLKLELGKQKVTSSSENAGSNKMQPNIIVNSLLSYLPPIMEVVDIKKYESKDPLYDAKSGKKKRELPTQIAKCRWFNSAQDKISEKQLPIESLKVLPVIPNIIFDTLTTYINAKGTITNSKRTILVEPKKISFRSGYYYLSGFDLISNKLIECEISPNEKEFELIKTAKLAIAPALKNFRGESDEGLKSVRDEIIDLINLHAENYIRIKYVNRLGKLTIRTIKNPRINNITENGESVPYIIADCLLRKEERVFRISRVQHLEILAIKANVE